jgi:primosomal protein N' (replication factor Y) (superfamily II helicase)
LSIAARDVNLTSPKMMREGPATQLREDDLPEFVDVMVPVHVNQKFTYRLPDALRAMVHLGSRVLVSLGHTVTTGYVVALRSHLKIGTSLRDDQIKEVRDLLDFEPPLTPPVLEITRWVSDYYAAPWGEVMRAALPAGINATVERTIAISDKGRRRLATVPGPASLPDDAPTRALRLLADEGDFELNAFYLRMGAKQPPQWLRKLEDEGLVDRSYRTRSSPTRAKRRKALRLIEPTAGGRITKAQQRAIEVLAQYENELPLVELIEKANISESVIRTLVKNGIAEEFEIEVRRDPLSRAELPGRQSFQLTEPQGNALSSIEQSLRGGKFASILLHGVTGSGKTEVYIKAMHAALKMNRGAIMLVPEIALTPILSRRLRAQFGDEIAIFHSSLSKGERFDEWSRLRVGEARIVLGTRSAVFAPVKDLGLIIIDEEQDSSYRQEESPFYHARDTAIVRAQKELAVAVLGTATPSLESFHNAQNGKYEYVQLPDRIANRPLARAEVIDMREVFARHQKPAAFSEELLEAINATHLRREQTIILLNRRGYSSFILCRSCGDSIECPNCDVTLTYHRGDQTLVCHYCNYYQRAPIVCPSCSSKYIYYVGEGTEQIEELLRKRFPRMRIGRIDRDTKTRRREFEKTLLDFGKGEIDLLVGTQMLAKGHDFHNVTLVGVVSVDAGLALPDFRAAERTFQLITQVAGRAGRGDLPGRVLVQTYHPEHYALRHAIAQDYRAFYSEEIRHRRNHGYPPFVALALLLVRQKDEAKAKLIAQQLRNTLTEANRDHSCRILGPAPAPFARLRGEHRIQLLVKSSSRKQMRVGIDKALKDFEAAGGDTRAVSLEIDPVNMM